MQTENELTNQLSQAAKTLSAQGLIAEALRLFPRKVFMTSSYGAEAAVLLNMVAKIEPSLPVVLLDTQKLFKETLEYAKTLNRKLGLTNLVVLKPEPDLVEAQDKKGNLWQSDPDSCCNLRKVLPLRSFLAGGGWKVWITGRKRSHGNARTALAKVEANQELIKLNPLADWDLAQVSASLTENNLPPHPLVAEGYSSIGCVKCTHKLNGGEFENIREGRWAHAPDKTECGIHTFDSGEKSGKESEEKSEKESGSHKQ